MTELEKHEEEQQKQSGYAESYFSAMKQRLNLQMLSAYIRDGSHKRIIHNESFCQRENASFLKLEKRIAEKCGEEAESAIEEINAYSSVIKEIYFNLGMKAGVVLYGKLTDNFETDV